MDKFTKKAVIVYIIIIGMIIIGVVLYKNRSRLVHKSKELTNALENHDFQTAQDIIIEYPECINVLPSMSPWWFQLITEQPAVCYPLQNACHWGNYDIIELLLEHGADCNLVWKGNWGSKSPLTYVIFSSNESKEDVINLLFNYGANRNYVDYCGKTPYDYALEEGYLELAELLKP